MTLTLSYWKGHIQHIDITIMIGAQPMLTCTVFTPISYVIFVM